MRSGDGIIVRVRPRGGCFSPGEARILADLAARLGNGHIDLTRRANLQIRGLQDEALPGLQAALGDRGLIDHDADSEAVRNVMVAPLAESARGIAATLEHALATDPRLRALPKKFGVLVDEGAMLSIAGERADIALRLHDDRVYFGLDSMSGTDWLGACAPTDAAPLAVTAMQAFLDCAPRKRMRDLPAADWTKVSAAVMAVLQAAPMPEAVGGRNLGWLDGTVGIAAPFGRLEAVQFQRLASLAESAGVREIRMSPWRAVYMAVTDRSVGEAMLREAEAAGLIVREDDPLLRIEACPGAPDCVSSSVDVRGDARRVARLAADRGFEGIIHVSGCAKGCARSAAAPLVLVGKQGQYRLARNATTRGPVERMVDPVDLPSIFREERNG